MYYEEYDLNVPCWRYHPTEEARIFETLEEVVEAEANGWFDSPDLQMHHRMDVPPAELLKIIRGEIDEDQPTEHPWGKVDYGADDTEYYQAHPVKPYLVEPPEPSTIFEPVKNAAKPRGRRAKAKK